MEEPIPAATTSDLILKNIENLDDILPTGDLRDRHADIEGKDTLIMRKAGTDFTAPGEKFPKELSIRFSTFETVVSLRYDTFDQFDIYALREELILISNCITNNLNHLV